MFKHNRKRGFTLIEMMVVVTIVGLLAAMAFPSYMAQVRKSRRSDGQNALTQAVQRMELQYARNTTYATATLQGGGNVAQSPEGYYTITIANQGVSNYTLQATPNTFRNADPNQDRVNQQLDPVSMFQIDSLGQKTHTRSDGVPPPLGWKTP